MKWGYLYRHKFSIRNSGCGFIISEPIPRKLRAVEGAFFDIDVWLLIENGAD